MFGVAIPRDEQAATHANGGTIGLKAQTTEQVDAWYAAALANGGSCEGPPGPRDFGAPLYGAYVRDPAGNKLCALRCWRSPTHSFDEPPARKVPESANAREKSGA